MIPRVAARLWVNALVRRVNAAGGFVTVVRHGDDSAGAIVLLLRARDGTVRALSRVTHAGGNSAWRIAAEQSPFGSEIIDDYLARQVRYDPDLWIIELDIANPERFIDEPILQG